MSMLKLKAWDNTTTLYILPSEISFFYTDSKPDIVYLVTKSGREIKVDMKAEDLIKEVRRVTYQDIS